MKRVALYFINSGYNLTKHLSNKGIIITMIMIPMIVEEGGRLCLAIFYWHDDSASMEKLYGQLLLLENADTGN